MQALALFLVIAAIVFPFYGARGFKQWCLAMGMLGLPLPIYGTLFHSPHQGWADGIKITASNLPLLLLLVHVIMRQGYQRIGRLVVFQAGMLFVVAIALSALNSTMLRATGLQMIMVAKVFLLYFCVPALAIQSREDLECAVKWLGIVIVIEAIYGCAQTLAGYQTYVFNSDGFRPEILIHPNGMARATGTLGYPNAYGGFLVPLFLLQICMYLFGGQRGKIRLLSFVAVFIAIICSGSRNAWICLSLSLVFVLVDAVRRRVITLRTILAMACVLLILCVPAIGLIRDRLTRSDHNAAESRIPLAQLALKVIQAHPIIGVGGNTYANVAKDYMDKNLEGMFVSIVHNQYLYVFAECGIIGLLAWLAIIAAVGNEAKRCYQEVDSNYAYAMGKGALFGVGAMLMAMLFDMFKSEASLGSMFLLGALCHALRENVYETGSPNKLAPIQLDCAPAR
jgi:O-antigen ligase